MKRTAATTRYELTPIFNTKEDGPPIRAGVYEGSAVGWPNSGYSLQHGFYYWSGREWGGMQSSVEAANRARAKGGPFRVNHWRGVVPGPDYAFDSVDATLAPKEVLAGTLLRADAQDVLLVSRLEVDVNELELVMTRTWGAREPVDFSLRLTWSTNAFVGSVRGQVRRFELPASTEIRLCLTATDVHERTVELSLTERTGRFDFSGALRVAGAQSEYRSATF